MRYRRSTIRRSRRSSLSLMIGVCTLILGIAEVNEVAARRLTPKLVIPMHWGTFPYIEVDTDAWAAKMKDAGFNARVMQPGESIEI